MRPSLLCLALLALTGAPLAAQAGATLDLRVSESSGRPLRDVQVEVLAPHRLSGTTDSHGHARIGRVPVGTQMLRVHRLGFDTQSLTVDLEPGDTVQLDLTLAASSIALDTVTATRDQASRALERVGFFERQRVTGGHYVTRADLDRHLGEPTHSLFYRVPGVSIAMKRGRALLFSKRGPASAGGPGVNSCSMRIWVDGAVWSGDLDEISQESIEAIEVYTSPADLPVQYGGADNSCGVVLIWTRH